MLSSVDNLDCGRKIVLLAPEIGTVLDIAFLRRLRLHLQEFFEFRIEQIDEHQNERQPKQTAKSDPLFVSFGLDLAYLVKLEVDLLDEAATLKLEVYPDVAFGLLQAVNVQPQLGGSRGQGVLTVLYIYLDFHLRRVVCECRLRVYANDLRPGCLRDVEFQLLVVSVGVLDLDDIGAVDALDHAILHDVRPAGSGTDQDGPVDCFAA